MTVDRIKHSINVSREGTLRIEIPYKDDFTIVVEPTESITLRINYTDPKSGVVTDISYGVKVMSVSFSHLDFSIPVTGDMLAEVMTTITNLIEMKLVDHIVSNF